MSRSIEKNERAGRGNFFIGFALNFASIISFVAISFNLGVTIHDIVNKYLGSPWRFYSLIVSLLFAAIYMYVISYIRPGFEEKLQRYLDELGDSG